VLGELLGLSAEDLAGLHARGVIRSEEGADQAKRA
jgi:hypothetical protein